MTAAAATAACLACMRPLSADVAAVSLYCSTRCRREHNKRIKQLGAAIASQHPKGTVLTASCGHCRCVFAVPSGAGSTKRYCSATCRGRASEARKAAAASASARASKPATVLIYTLKPVAVSHSCALPGCLNEFARTGRGRLRQYCSRKCVERAKTIRRRKSCAIVSRSVVDACPILCTVCRTPAKPSLLHCSGDCRAYDEYIAGARFYAVRIGQRQGGFVRVDTVEVKK